MADFDTIDPIDDDEILYRRIPVSTGWFQPDKMHLVVTRADGEVVAVRFEWITSN